MTHSGNWASVRRVRFVDLGPDVRVLDVFVSTGDDMFKEYDSPLHAPPQYKTMESRPRELNEKALDAAIADMVSAETPDAPVETPKVAQVLRPEFPELASQADCDESSAERASGVAALLRQKWASLSGAA